MQSKKLELLLSKIPEETQNAFFAELKDANPDEYEALLDCYGIVLDEEEKKFLITPSARNLSNGDLEGVAGGKDTEVHHCNPYCRTNCGCD